MLGPPAIRAATPAAIRLSPEVSTSRVGRGAAVSRSARVQTRQTSRWGRRDSRAVRQTRTLSLRAVADRGNENCRRPESPGTTRRAGCLPSPPPRARHVNPGLPGGRTPPTRLSATQGDTSASRMPPRDGPIRARTAEAHRSCRSSGNRRQRPVLRRALLLDRGPRAPASRAQYLVSTPWRAVARVRAVSA